MHLFEAVINESDTDKFREFTSISSKRSELQKKKTENFTENKKIHSLWSMEHVGRNATKSWF